MDRSGPMVAVCLAPADLRPEVDDLTGAVRADPRRSDLTAAESAALEHALRVAEAWGGWVLAVACGPPDIEVVLQQVAALGAGVVRVETGAHALSTEPGPAPVSAGDLSGDPMAVAAALAAAIRRRGTPAMVFCGDRSAGPGVGAVPAFLSYELGIGQALGLVSVTPDGPGRLLVERRLDGGWRERMAVRAPAVLSVEGAGVRLRRAGLAAVLDTCPAAVEHDPGVPGAPGTAGADPGSPAAGSGGHRRVGVPRPYRPRPHPVPAPEGDPHVRLLSLTGALSTREPARVVGPLDPAEAADELLSYLERFGYTD